MRDLASVKASLNVLTTNMEHQGTLWHATPFGMVFLCRILEKALAESGQNPVAHFLAEELLDFFAYILQCFHSGDGIQHAEALCRILEKALAESGQNPVAHFLAEELLDFFAYILQCFHSGDGIQHAEALPLFSDLLREEYLWSEEYNEEEDEMRYEEDEVFPDDLFYSFYDYSWQAVLAYRHIWHPSKLPSMCSRQIWSTRVPCGTLHTFAWCS